PADATNSSASSARYADESARRSSYKLAGRVERVWNDARHAAAMESFRTLRTILEGYLGDNEGVFTITSAVPREGKSTVSLNLARAFAADGETRTLLVDADLRRREPCPWLQPLPERGLGEILARRATFAQAIIRVGNSALDILVAGSATEDTARLLSKERVAEIVAWLRQRYRRVIIDTPPVILFSDALPFAAEADGVVVVTRAGWTPLAQYERAIDALGDARILGTVLNQAFPNLLDRETSHDHYYQRYYRRYYGPRRTAR
ncbi:MAG: CpsD/CapB family tyrosine-protein kinase, partial [Acidobacteriota bacterium]